jgi:lipoprotein-releasing system ATP-binding protein
VDKETVIELRGIRKVFNPGSATETEVLHGIDLRLYKGDFCAVVGPSGSGKSTLLNIIGLLDRPSAGTLQIASQETTLLGDTDLTRLRGHTIGFVFQYHHLMTAFTALENVMIPLMAATGFCNPAIAQRALLLLDSVGLAPWKDNMAGNLRGGQQQRVSIARALAMNPAVLLADEPTGNLDTKSADLVFELLRKVNREQGTTVLFVTHNPELAARCDKTIEVVDGMVRV